MKRALEQAARGELRDLGSFAQYAHDEEELGCVDERENRELLLLAQLREADVLAGRDELIRLEEVMEEFKITRNEE
jgi:hypothetical protein